MLVLRLQKSGFLVDAALSGESGLKQALHFKPDVILLDIAMPDMGGWEVCRTLKEQAHTKEIPIVIVTAKHIPNVVHKAKEAGADKVMQKPFDGVELIRMLHSIVK